MSIYNKKEELPKYFNSIIFENKKALKGAYGFFTQLFEYHIDEDKNIEDRYTTLTDLLKNQRISKRTKEGLTMLGKIIHSVLSFCNLSDEEIIFKEINNNIDMICKTKDGKDAILSFCRYSDKFVINSKNEQEKYLKQNGYNDGGILHFYNPYNLDDQNSLSILCTYRKQTEVINDNKYYETEEVTKEYSSEPSEAISITDGDYSANVIINNKFAGNIDVEGISNYVRNLTLPTTAFDILKDLDDKKLVLNNSCKKLNLAISTYYLNNEESSVKFRDDELSFVKDYDKKEESTIVFYEGQWQYSKDNFYLKNYYIPPIPNKPAIIELNKKPIAEEQAHEYIDKAINTYQKTLEKLPSWAKRI